MIETHPFGIFVPHKPKYLLLGSFPAYSKEGFYEWFYASKRSQFWTILEKVYEVKLPDKESRQDLCIKLHLAMSDIIYQCERRSGNSLDANLVNIVYNTKLIEKFLGENKIQKIFFTSRYVEKGYKTKFKELILKYPEIELVTLPSPSPRYALMTKEEKIIKYKEQLPKFSV